VTKFFIVTMKSIKIYKAFDLTELVQLRNVRQL